MSNPPFNTYLGTRILKKDQGEAEVALELEPHHLNRRGVAHGGVIASLLDSALGAAVISAVPDHWWCATISLSTQFLDGARTGKLTARGRVVRRGARVAFATGEVHDDAGRLIATASGSWHLWSYLPGRRPAPAGPWVTMRDSGERITVGKIIAVGRNYAEHAREMGNAPGAPLVLFLKPASAILHDEGVVRAPFGAGSLHHEVELVVVIGSPGSGIPADRAMEHVLGYAVGLDMTLRDVQSRAKERGEPWSLAKGFDTSAPVSAVAPRDDVGDGSGLAIRLDVNGEQRQSDNTSSMQRTVAELIVEASRWMRLERGDLIFTGTPAGVGPVATGDLLQAHLDRVGTLTVRIETED